MTDGVHGGDTTTSLLGSLVGDCAIDVGESMSPLLFCSLVLDITVETQPRLIYAERVEARSPVPCAPHLPSPFEFICPREISRNTAH